MRTKAHVGKPYRMRISRNYVDARFCPVTWLLLHFKVNGIVGGPIFQKIVDGVARGDRQTPLMWEDMTGRMFKLAGLKCTNHAIRRSAAQWCGRCHGSLVDCANTGRWKSFAEMAKYCAAGSSRRKTIENDTGADDPIYKVWVWKVVVVGSASGCLEL